MTIGEEIRNFIASDGVKDKYIDLVSYASDAGFYYLVPKVVVQPQSEEEIGKLLAYSNQKEIPIVFRGGGTSLSGQSITDGILVELGRFWNKVKVENEGETVRVLPGITGQMVNAHLKKYKRKIGPDPSSINAAMMGGILSNNASGMCCGVAQNSYHTIQHIRFMLPNGKVFSTESQSDYLRFETECADVFLEIKAIKAEIEENSDLKSKIREKYKTKNTVGYSLNAFIDFEHPLDIFAHLLVGGEGTLGFISEAVMHTVVDFPFKSTGLLYFNDIYSACQAIIPLVNAGALMVELMDRASLRSVEAMDGMPAIVKTLPDRAAALLVEFQANTIGELQKTVDGFAVEIPKLNLIAEPEFSLDPAVQAFYWKVRKGLFPAVGAVRASGTTVVLEDVAFPLESLGDAIIDIQELFKKYEYHNGIIFGHAKDGNLHFVVTQTFGSEKEIARYDMFIRDIVELVVEKYNGSLKAEHGTGRNMAPFVETEWGKEAYALMKRLKSVVDPKNLLNPGVIINENKKAHIQNLKKMPSVEEEVDRCIECGFCEPNCPSKNFSSSPRRRIVVRRVLENLKSEKKTAEYQSLVNQFQFEGLDSCAVDGLCAINCPVEINTGDLVKKLRVNSHSMFENKAAFLAAKNFGVVVDILRTGVDFGNFLNKNLGKETMKRLTSFAHSINDSFPTWSNQIPETPNLGFENTKNISSETTIVYFPSCITRMMGTYAHKEKNLINTFYSVCNKASINIKVLNDIKNACCGQIFGSKGYKEAFDYTANAIFENMWRSSEEGKYSVVIDVSSCHYTLKNMYAALNSVNRSKFHQLKVLDSVDFIHEYVLPKLPAKSLKDEIVLHPVCSLQKLKTQEKFIEVAKAYAKNVIVPINAGCCGMAGDRGFLLPELTNAATLEEAKEVKNIKKADGYYSSTKTCEMAMTDAVGANYESILYLIDEAV